MTVDLSARPERAASPAGLRHSPLAEWGRPFGALAPAITVTERPFLAHTTLWVDPDSAAGRAVADRLGVRLPTCANSFLQGITRFGEVQVLWMGPAEFLLISPEGSDAVVRSAVEEAVDGGRADVVDVSAQRTTLALSGPHARDVLAHGCSADLHPRAAPTGTCLSTLVAQTGTVLQVLDAGAGHFQILVRSSFAGYLAAWLQDAAVEYLAPIAPAVAP